MCNTNQNSSYNYKGFQSSHSKRLKSIKLPPSGLKIKRSDLILIIKQSNPPEEARRFIPSGFDTQ